MTTDCLELRNARKYSDSYAQECDCLIAEHKEAMECRRCEAFLQMGIDAFNWLIRADRSERLAVIRGEKSFDAAVEEDIQARCKRWLEPIPFAEEWIAVQSARGYQIDNLEDFRDCVREMAAIVAAQGPPQSSLPAPMQSLRDAAMQEHRNGETAEFI